MLNVFCKCGCGIEGVVGCAGRARLEVVVVGCRRTRLEEVVVGVVGCGESNNDVLSISCCAVGL